MRGSLRGPVSPIDARVARVNPRPIPDEERRLGLAWAQTVIRLAADPLAPTPAEAADIALILDALGVPVPKAAPLPVTVAPEQPEGYVGLRWLAVSHWHMVHAVINDDQDAVCGVAPIAGGRWLQLLGVLAADAHRCARCERYLAEGRRA